MRLVLSLWPLLLSGGVLLGANGLQSTLLAVRGGAEGFPPLVVGLLLSAYYAGLVVGCQAAPGIVRDVGHIRAFTAFASIASAATLLHAVVVDEAVWLGLRVATGFSFAVLQMIVEAWLNERATNETRGQVLSAYRITDFAAVTALQSSLVLFDPMGFTLFALLSVLVSVALVPVALTRIEAPAPPASARLDLGALWRLSPVAAAGAALVGLTASSFWAMSPVFVAGYGYAPSDAGPFVGAIILGGALSQAPVGWLSDHLDRRLVLLGTTVGASGMALVLPVAAGVSLEALLGAAALFGALALPGFGLSIAHANDHARPGTTLSVNGGMLLLYGAAAIAGPVIASQAIARFGPEGLFWWVAGGYALLALFCTYRMTRRAAPEPAAPYVAVPRTSPAVFALDPRTEEGEAQSPR